MCSKCPAKELKSRPTARSVVSVFRDSPVIAAIVSSVVGHCERSLPKEKRPDGTALSGLRRLNEGGVGAWEIRMAQRMSKSEVLRSLLRKTEPTQPTYSHATDISHPPC